MPFHQAPVGLFSPLTPAEILELNTAIDSPLPPPPYVPLRAQVALGNLGQGGRVTAREEMIVMNGWGGPEDAGVPGAPIPPGQCVRKPFQYLYYYSIPIVKHCNYGVVVGLSRRDRARWYRGVPPKIDFDIGRRITKPNLILYGLDRGIPFHTMRYAAWGPLRAIFEKADYMARTQANGNPAIDPPSY